MLDLRKKKDPGNGKRRNKILNTHTHTHTDTQKEQPSKKGSSPAVIPRNRVRLGKVMFGYVRLC